MAFSPFFGYTPNPVATEQYVAQPDVGESPITCRHFADDDRKVDTGLWIPLRKIKPSWRRGAQGIGDCVSWGHELCATMLMAIQHLKGMGTFEAEAATEPIYGGGRADAQGSRGGWSDGSWGSAAVKWLTKWGVLLRKDYSKETGNPEHDLTTYSSSKAKQWGNYGCGGSQDALGEGPLDKVARRMPIVRATLVTDVMQAAIALQNGYPISVCSGVGYGGMRRNSEGIVRRSGSWNHCMMLGGVRWRRNEPQFRQFQSWGSSASGPDPDINDEAVSACSWWCVAEDIESQLRGRDSYILADVHGMPLQELPYVEMGKHWDLTQTGEAQFIAI